MSFEHELKQLPKPADTQAALEEVLTKLQSIGVTPILIGGLALSCYGLERYTKDVDLAVTVTHTAQCQSLFEANDPRPLPIGGVSVLTSSGVRVDLIDRRLEYQTLFEEAIEESLSKGFRVMVGSLQIAVILLPYLVASKLLADRPQDEVDLRFLLTHASLDYAKTRALVYQHLGKFGAQYLDKLARAAGRTDTPKEYGPRDS